MIVAWAALVVMGLAAPAKAEPVISLLVGAGYGATIRYQPESGGNGPVYSVGVRMDQVSGSAATGVSDPFVSYDANLALARAFAGSAIPYDVKAVSSMLNDTPGNGSADPSQALARTYQVAWLLDGFGSQIDENARTAIWETLSGTRFALPSTGLNATSSSIVLAF